MTLRRAAVALLTAAVAIVGASAPSVAQSPTVHAAAATPAAVPSETLRVAHFSSRVFNTRAQQASDFRKVIRRGYAWVTFTEVGKDRKRLKRIARNHRYRVYAPTGTDGAIIVKRSLIKGGWRTGKVQVIHRSGKQLGSSRPFGPKAVAWVRFKTKNLGRISVSTGHYLTGGRVPGQASIHGPGRVNHYALNRRYAKAIGNWARHHGRGNRLAFYGGDQNINDRHRDTFFGQPLTTSWDELGKWRKTHAAGPIDVIASFNRDGRVTALGVRRFRDRALHLHSDHFLVQTRYRIKYVRSAR